MRILLYDRVIIKKSQLILLFFNCHFSHQTSEQKTKFWVEHPSKSKGGHSSNNNSKGSNRNRTGGNGSNNKKNKKNSSAAV